MRTITVLLLATLVTACASQALQQREADAAIFVGQPEDELVRQNGVPTRVVEAGGRRFLAYEDTRTQYARPIPSFTPRWSRFGHSMEVRPEEMVILTCETTFEVAEGKVAAFRLHGNGCG